MCVLFYPSRNNNTLNGRVWRPEQVNGHVMLNATRRYQVRELLPGTRAICDSGAFQDIDQSTRLSPEQALQRQLEYEQRLQRYLGQDWHFEAVCIYDQMAGVDEQFKEVATVSDVLVDDVFAIQEVSVCSKKVKCRGTVETAAHAVEETVRAAVYYASQRHRIHAKLMFIGQGVTSEQYEGCVREMLSIIQPGDWFGFGGFCILGRQPSLMKVFRETVERVVPLVIGAGINRLHLLGLCYPPAVQVLNDIGKRYRVRVSTDSSAPEVQGAAFGSSYDAITGRSVNRTKRTKWIDYHPYDLAMENIKAYHQWSSSI